MTELLANYNTRGWQNIGICGAHRTGKTTLAKALAKRLNMPFVEIGASVIFKEHGLNPALPMPFYTRFLIQRKVLDHSCNIWFKMDQPFICDRTPIDMMAYTLADVLGNTLTDKTEGQLSQYLDDCRIALKKYFDHLVLVPPAIPIVNEQGKASCSKGYIDHVHYLCLGLFHDAPVSSGFVIDESDVHIDARVGSIVRYLNV